MPVKILSKIDERKVTDHTVPAKRSETVDFMADESCSVIFETGEQLVLDGENPGSIAPAPKGSHPLRLSTRTTRRQFQAGTSVFRNSYVLVGPPQDGPFR
jgi:hypothetical protein